MSSTAPLLRSRGLHKRYAAPVLTDFDFELAPGEVHALVGSNGAGKSTFARILCGLTRADAGETYLADKRHAPTSKQQAERAGVVMVLQELNVVPTLSIAENIFLPRLPQRLGFLRRGALLHQANEALARVGLDDLDPRIAAGSLGIGHQQLVEIAAALARDCRLLILDEPTAALTDPEIERLFDNIRRLKSQGVGILYISHRMDEIRRIADRVTVMRDGRRIATHPAADGSQTQLVREMAGHDLPVRQHPSRGRPGAPALNVRNLHAGARVQGVSFELRFGEIVGLAGVVGSGRTETLRAVFGASPVDSGGVFVCGRAARIRKPREAVLAGIAMVGEDRKRDGLLLPQSIRVNTTLSDMPRHAFACSWINLDAETNTATGCCSKLQIQCTSPEQPTAELSGGNQQKVVIARWLVRDCPILLFDEPTRGVDAAAKDAIHALLRRLAAEGKAILVVSSELPELMSLCDRILVMSAGRIAGEFTPGTWSQDAITRSAFSGYLDRTTGDQA